MAIIKQVEMGEYIPVGISYMIWHGKKHWFIRIPLPIKMYRYSYIYSKNTIQRLNLYFTQVIPVHFDWREIDD